MQTFNFFTNYWVWGICVALLVAGCRKELELENVSTIDNTEGHWMKFPFYHKGNLKMMESSADESFLYFVTVYQIHTNFGTQYKNDLFQTDGTAQTKVRQLDNVIRGMAPVSGNEMGCLSLYYGGDLRVEVYSPAALQQVFYADVYSIANTTAIYDFTFGGSDFYYGGIFRMETSISTTLRNVSGITPIQGTDPFEFPGLNGEIRDVDVYNGDIYACGKDGAGMAYITKWEGTQWTTVHNFALNGSVMDMEWYNDTIYAILESTNQTNPPVVAVANGTHWNIDQFTRGSAYDPTKAKFLLRQGKLYVYGVYANTAEGNSGGVYALENMAWNKLGKGSEIVTDLAFANGYAYAIIDNSIRRLKL